MYLRIHNNNSAGRIYTHSRETQREFPPKTDPPTNLPIYLYLYISLFSFRSLDILCATQLFQRFSSSECDEFLGGALIESFF